MSFWPGIKASARSLRAEAERLTGSGASLAIILAHAVAEAGVMCVPRPPSDPLLGGGDARLDVESEDDPIIWHRDDVSPQLALFLVAHELAHHCLHEGGFTCFPEHFDVGASEEDIPATRAEPYSPRSLKERQANVWAREFLLPTPQLRARYLRAPITASALAAEVGLDEKLVRRQMARALLTVEPEAPPPPPEIPALNDRQREAAHVPHGPLLVMAGPGTGKTSTLTGRICFLLDKDVPAEDIVAITFSRKAAEEMRNRLARVRPAEADAVRLDTVHAFCYDLLLEYGAWPKADVLDSARQIGLLERLLPHLPLEHFQYLPDPAARLGDIARAIDRAKCDLIGPAEFAAQAQADLDAAKSDFERGRIDEDGFRRAERVAEVAEVYTIYQREVERIERYDYGDLVMKAVSLLEADREIREEVRGERHFLVDEFQDLNVAGARFVKLLARDGERLWVVGDPCQAIYRFRGASTSGILGFEEDYPEAADPVSLDVNYRSLQEIIDLFQATPPHMHASYEPMPRWTSARGEGGSFTFRLAESPEAELAGVARTIKEVACDVAYRDQAVLARKHTHLAEIAQALEDADVPVLFLAGFFEREVVRDMLSLIELTCWRRGHSLLRVAAFPEYGVPAGDARLLIRAAAERRAPFPEALELAAELEGLSVAGRTGLLLLRDHLDGVEFFTFPWELLSGYLFNKSGYLQSFPADDQTERPVLNQRRRVALFQLLQIAYSYSYTGGRNPREAFLDYVRGLARSTEHRQLAQVPEWAAGIDAVRLLTVHGAKGLEFEAVHIPMLNEWDFYDGFISERTNVPPRLLADDPRQELEAEQQCLFFVAVSRARGFLGLSRSELRYNSRAELKDAEPSPALVAVAEVLPRPLTGAVDWEGMPAPTPPPDRTPVPARPVVSAAELEAYLECPRRYGYVHEFGLEARAETTAYLTLARCVRETVDSMIEDVVAGKAPDLNAAIRRVTDLWDERGDDGHFYNGQYRFEATRRVANAHFLLAQNVRVAAPEFEVERSKATIRVSPDLVVHDGRQVRVQRWTAGNVDWREERRPLYWILREGAKAAGFPWPIVEAVSAATGEVRQIQVRSSTGDAVDAALDGMHRGHYPASPDEHRCPSCPFYFMCQPDLSEQSFRF